SWWTFRRRNGLVALLPTGTILAVEIINDPNPGLYLFTVFWLVCAAGILLRLNFVALKRRWRSRRVPRAADTGWIFGEVGFEATALLLLVAFVLPPLSTVDISTSFLPGSISTDLFHPFGLGVGKPGNGASASVGYSETVRPGAQLKARSQEIMMVSGGSAHPGRQPFDNGKGDHARGGDGPGGRRARSGQHRRRTPGSVRHRGCGPHIGHSACPLRHQPHHGRAHCRRKEPAQRRHRLCSLGAAIPAALLPGGRGGGLFGRPRPGDRQSGTHNRPGRARLDGLRPGESHRGLVPGSEPLQIHDLAEARAGR